MTSLRRIACLLGLFLFFAAFSAPGQPAPPSPPCSAAAGERLRAQLTPWLEDRAASANFSGVVVAACDGRIVYSVAHGLANRETGERNNESTRFNLGSMNKMWTAVAVAQLVASGKVSVDAPVGTYLPDLPNAAVRDKVLVRHLLTHTSGLGSYFARGFLRDRVRPARAADYLPFFIDDAPAFTPGERMQYSNAGFALLGAIVERVSGQSYFDYVQKNVLERAGMTHASLGDVTKREAGVAVPYGRLPGASDVADMTAQLEVRGSPAGGALASAADLIAFSRALWAGRLIPMPLVDEFTRGKVEMGPTVKYAFGFGDGSVNGRRHVGHNGGAPGVGAEFLSFPETRLDLVVLTNMDQPTATQVIGRAAQIATGLDMPFTPPAAAGAFVPAALDKDGLPASPAGRRVAAFFTALAKGGEEYRLFIEQQMTPVEGRTPAQRAEAAASLKTRFGAMTIGPVVLQARDEIQVQVTTERGGRVRFIFSFEPGEPHRIMQIDMKPADGLD